MTPEAFEKEILEPMMAELLVLCRTKGVEYAGTEDKLANFKEAARAFGVTPYVALGIFLDKHYKAVQSFCRKGHVLSTEPIQGRIRDCQLYLALLEGLIAEAETLPAIQRYPVHNSHLPPPGEPCK